MASQHDPAARENTLITDEHESPQRGAGGPPTHEGGAVLLAFKGSGHEWAFLYTKRPIAGQRQVS